MTLTIITTTYNSAATVRDTLESVLRQTCHDYELLIVDGASKDNTLDIVKEYETRFEGRLRWVSEKDKGIYDAMNKGFRLAQGEVVGFLNSDDLYYDDHVVEDIVNAFKEPELGCIFGDLVYVDAKDTNKIVRTWKGSPYTKFSFRRGWQPAHPTFYVRRKWIDVLGGFDLEFDISADFEFTFRYLHKHQVPSKYIPRTFVRMRMGGESNNSIKNIIRGNKNIIRAFKKNGYSAGPIYPIRRLVPKVIDLILHKLRLK